jgi:hypothetical protein
MRRAVANSGVCFVVEIRRRTGPNHTVDLLEDWNRSSDYLFAAIGVLQRAIGAYESGILPQNDACGFQADPIQRVRRVLEKVPRAARALRDRYSGRETLRTEDEYDVQDLLRVLLTIDFEDIRREEWTPSDAGKSARMDLLLKTEQVVIEVKITKPGRAEKQIGDELIVDIARYETHPDCKTLVCFVYDPTGQIGNPAALERDLSKDEPIKVEVIVAPKH